MNFTRRDFGKVALAALPASTLLAAKPDSKWGGVQVGINAPYSFTRMSGTADKIIEYMTQLNLSATELRLQPVEALLGAPGVFASANDNPNAAAGRGGGGGGAARGGSGRGGGGARGGSGGFAAGRGGSGRGGGGRAPLTPEQQEAAKKLEDWRLALSMDKIKEVRKKFEDAGILIQIVKIDNFNSFSDGVTDYFFTAAKALGANALSTEGNLNDIDRLGKFADKHKMMIGYHGHTAGPGGDAFGDPSNWEKAMSVAKYNGINLDLGHYLVGQHQAGKDPDPIPFLTKYHDHVTHVHVKDRTLDGKTVPFGQGDVKITEVLQLMKKNKWKFQATIEYEYQTPAGSDVLTELGKCVEYCHKALA